MLDKPKREETIFYNGTLFRKGDIVTIKTSGTYGTERIGRISGIDISHFWLDMSEQYRENVQRFEYGDIDYMEYASGTADSKDRQEGRHD